MSAEELSGGHAPEATDDIMAAAMNGFEEIGEDDARLIELVGYLVQGIVAYPDDVEVEEYFDEIGTVYGVRVHPEDVGRVIGKEGRVANALRHMVKAAATKSGARVTVEIITDDTPIHVVDSDEPAPAGDPTHAADNNGDAGSEA